MANQIHQITNANIIKDFISQILLLKYYYIVSFLGFLGIAFTANRYLPVVYEVHTVIGPIEDQRPALLGSNDLFRGLVSYEQARNLENDINNIKSFSLVSTTLNKLDLEVGYFAKKENILGHDNQVYPNPPFHVSIDKSHIQPVNVKFDLTFIDNSTYRLTMDEDEVSLYNYIDNDIVSEKNSIRIDTICKFNETISNRYFRFVVSMTNNSVVSGPGPVPEYYFVLYNLDDLARSFLEKIEVKAVTLRSSLINISLQGKNSDLTIDFLNIYIQTFLDDNLSKKNKMSQSAVSFIDAQISSTSDSLDISESRLMDYRSANQVMDLSYQGQQAFQQMTQVESDRLELEIQERYYNSILDNFEKNKDVAGVAPPSAANINDPIMNTLILELHTLNTER